MAPSTLGQFPITANTPVVVSIQGGPHLSQLRLTNNSIYQLSTDFHGTTRIVDAYTMDRLIVDGSVTSQLVLMPATRLAVSVPPMQTLTVEAAYDPDKFEGVYPMALPRQVFDPVTDVNAWLTSASVDPGASGVQATKTLAAVTGSAIRVRNLKFNRINVGVAGVSAVRCKIVSNPSSTLLLSIVAPAIPVPAASYEAGWETNVPELFGLANEGMTINFDASGGAGDWQTINFYWKVELLRV